MALDVCSVWVGATTDTTARVRARLVAATSSTLQVADNEAMTGPVTLGPTAPGTDNVITWDVTGLDPDTRYWCVVDDGAPNTSFKATFRTQPGAAGERLSYIFGAAGDAGLGGDGDEGTTSSGVSNSAVFDTMKAQSLAEEWAWFSHLGDLHYNNIATNDASLYRAAYFETMNYGGVISSAARQGQFLRSVASTYVWDDHDYGPNDSDRTSAGKPAAQQVYREWVPHYTLPDAAGIYQSWQVGRVLYIASDVRSFRDPNSDPQTAAKTMLGSAQKTWMETLLASTSAEALVWQVPSRWVGGTDTWTSFLHERTAMVEMFGDLGWLDRMIYMTADMHALSICSGPNNPAGRFPMFMFASMDSGAWSTGSEYDIGSVAGRRQYGTMRVQDTGHTIALTGTGYHDGTAVMSHTAYVHVGSPVFSVPYTSLSDPFSPTDDDRYTRNRWAVQRQDGGEYEHEQTTGPLNTSDPEDDPQGVGPYSDSITVNVYSDDQLPDQASWRVHEGTNPHPRFSSVRINLQALPSLADDVTGLALGDKITVTSPPSWLPPDDINLIAEGAAEEIGVYEWDITLNTTPAQAFDVAQVATDAASAGPNSPNRLDTAGSQLAATVGTSDTELVVHTPQDGPFDRSVWLNSAGPGTLLASHFPLDLSLGGETVRATAMEPYRWDQFTRTVAAGGWGTASSGQAWTSTGEAASDRSVDGTRGLITMAANTSNLRFQRIASGLADCEILVSITPGQLSTGQPIVPGVLLRYSSGAAYYRCRLQFTTSGTVDIAVTNVVTAIGATVSTGLTYVAGTKFWLRVRIIGQTIYGRVWKDGLREPVWRWHIERTVTSSTLDTGDVGVTCSALGGNTNVSPIVYYDDFQIVTPQRATVTRSINTISKAHAAGTDVSLARPAAIGL